jgi:hypothetical protein
VTGRRRVIRGILRVLRWISWSSLAGFAIFEIAVLETMARRGGASLPNIEMALAELFAVFCCAVAVDRAFSLGEKSFDERD